jgi:hypothetical protein
MVYHRVLGWPTRWENRKLLYDQRLRFLEICFQGVDGVRGMEIELELVHMLRGVSVMVFAKGD